MPRTSTLRFLTLLLTLLLLGRGVAWAGEALQIHFVDVGEGDAALIVSPAGKTVLIDAGPVRSSGALLGFLKAQGRGPLDLVLLTHCHVDHFGGMARVMQTIGARMFLVGPCPSESDAYHRLLETVARLKIPLKNATAGRKLDLGGGAVLTLLGPPAPPLEGTRSDANANSVVARLQLGATAVLFTGDAERPTEKWLLSSAEKAELRADVLKVAHHGSRYTTSAGFLNAVKPRIAVISLGTPNEYGHPSDQILSRLQRAGVRVYRTDEAGTVTVQSDGKQVEVRTSTPVAGGKP